MVAHLYKRHDSQETRQWSDKGNAPLQSDVAVVFIPELMQDPRAWAEHPRLRLQTLFKVSCSARGIAE